MSFNHQDWKPVVFKKQEPKKIVHIQKRNPLEDPENDSCKVPMVSSELAKTIQQARILKKVSQKELAQKCNMDVSKISAIESKKAVYNAQDIVKIAKVLGINTSTIPKTNFQEEKISV
jgi:ribosome-binding protein aMBF1 (putative translation factor)